MNKQRWNPTYIKRVLKKDIDSSMKPVLVRTDKGLGYFKALGNPEGPHCLAREFVGTSLADLLGISTFKYGIIHFDGAIEIQLLNGGIAQCGRGFITQKERGEVWNGSIKDLKRITNVEDITRLVCVDTWVRNPDRYCVWKNGIPHERFDNVFLSRHSETNLVLKSFDFSHAGFCETGKASQAYEETVYGLFPQFKEFLREEAAKQISDKLKTIKSKHIRMIIDQIPSEWDIDAAMRDIWVEFLVARAGFLSENFIRMIGLQDTLRQRTLFDKE